jgi:prolyl oligopeptidase PreP (S9A serine peptidase family)
MHSYSPLQNVRPLPRNPAHLVVIADQDHSARPGQVYQCVAARQESIARSSGYSPVLLRLVRGEGHTEWPPAKTRRVLAEEIAFLWHFASTGARASS